MAVNPEHEAGREGLLTPESLAERGELQRVFKEGAASERSEKHLENEDTLLERPERKFAAVFDGMGGHAAGEEASRIAKETIASQMARVQKNLPSEKLKQAFADMLGLVSEKIAKDVKKNPERSGMATTATLAKIVETEAGREAVIAHVGDSRAYLVRPSGEVLCITLDDAVWRPDGDAIFARKTQDKLSSIRNEEDLSRLSSQEELYFQNRNVVSGALDGTQPSVRVYAPKLTQGDRILLTSDGIHDAVSDSELQEFFAQQGSNNFSPSEVAQRLVALARERGRDATNLRAKEDDRTAVMLDPDAAEFQYGDSVAVKRSSGEVEAGWQVGAFQKGEQGELRVRATSADAEGRPIQKDIRIEDLRAQNPR